MKNNEIDREFERLIEGRLKRLNGINLKEELDCRENISELSNYDGREVFSE